MIEDFNKAFDSMISFDISAVAEAVEFKMPLLMESVLYQKTSHLVKGSVFDPNDIEKKVKVNNDYFNIRIQEPYDEPDTLIVAYINMYAKERKLDRSLKKTITIEGIGKYKRIDFICSDFLSINYDLVMAIIKAIVETSYSWLFNKIRYNVGDTHAFSSVLYSRLKTALAAREDICKTIWFVVKEGDQCLLLLDRDNILSALKSLNEFNIHPNASPYKLLDEFVNMRLPFDKAFALEAMRAGKCIDGIISEGKYFKELPLLALTQINIFSREVSVYPILTSGKDHLYMSFPTKYRAIMEPILDLHKESLIHEFKELSSRFKKMIKSMKMHKMDVEKVAEFLGTFAASYTRTLLQG